tara:strand:+ start:54 stop:260 length:207 start_codon:yes stop_codon:yes gene_type:complete
MRYRTYTPTSAMCPGMESNLKYILQIHKRYSRSPSEISLERRLIMIFHPLVRETLNIPELRAKALKKN